MVDELAALVSGFRAQLEWHARGGAHAVSSAPTPVADIEGAPIGSETAPPAEARATRMSLVQVRQDLGECTRCKLSATRNKIVFGVGDPHAPLMFVGEAPGADEDRLGDPFVGRAGQLLDKMTLAMGWPRESVYIANVLKCRPPGNRNPEADEVEACEPFLARQIDAIAPRLIVTLGKPAAQLLLRSNAPISALRGTFHSYRGIKVMPTFHPAFLLRSPERKRDTWNDLKQVIAELERLGIEPPQPPRA
jgi:DNA polymerase